MCSGSTPSSTRPIASMLARQRPASVRLSFIVVEPPEKVTSPVTSAIIAAPDTRARKRSRIDSKYTWSVLRIMKRAVARSGMMLAAVPPSSTIPWTRACWGSCWRQSPIAWSSSTTASSAFLPSQGSLAACAAFPENATSTSSLASRTQFTMSRSAGWKRSAASSPSKSPSSSMNCLPLPRSSAGVPKKTTSPAKASRTAARAIAAPTPEAAIVLWPQPWPRPGNASYSARTPIRGPSGPSPPLSRPRTAVARRPAGCSTA